MKMITINNGIMTGNTRQLAINLHKAIYRGSKKSLGIVQILLITLLAFFYWGRSWSCIG